MKKPTCSKLLAFLTVAIACGLFLFPTPKATPPIERDFAEIVASGRLKAVSEYNFLAYQVKEDSVTGFYYELVSAFARDYGLTLDMVSEPNFEKRLEGLANRTYDLIATGILATSELKDSLLLTIPILRNKEVLVQRKKELLSDTLHFIQNPLQLAGKTLHVEGSSPSILRIRNLSNEIGDTIYVAEMSPYGTEQLIALVASGDIEYAVCNESIARKAADSMPQIDVSTAISFNQFYSLGVSKQSPVLHDTLNAWLSKFMKTKEYRQLYRKYLLMQN